MDIFLLGTGLLASGYFINKTPKYPRADMERQTISINEIPVGNTVYNSNQFEKNNQEIQDKLSKNYELGMDPQNTNMVRPNYRFLNDYSSDNQGLFKNKENFGVPPTSDPSNSRGFTKQPSLQAINNAYPTFGQYTSNKKEVPALFEPQPENIYAKNAIVDFDTSRFDTSLRHNGVNPFQEFPEPPLFTQGPAQIGTTTYDLRVMPKTSSELYLKQRPTLTNISAFGGISLGVKPLEDTTFETKRPRVYETDRYGQSFGGTTTLYNGNHGEFSKNIDKVTSSDRQGNSARDMGISETSYDATNRDAVPRIFSSQGLLDAKMPVADNLVYDYSPYVPNHTVQENYDFKDRPGNIQRNTASYVDNIEEPSVTLQESVLHLPYTYPQINTIGQVIDYDSYKTPMTLKEVGLENDFTNVSGGMFKAFISRDKAKHSDRVELKSRNLHASRPTPSGPVDPPSKSKLGKVKLNSIRKQDLVTYGNKDFNPRVNSKNHLVDKNSPSDRINQTSSLTVSQLASNPFTSFLSLT